MNKLATNPWFHLYYGCKVARFDINGNRATDCKLEGWLLSKMEMSEDTFFSYKLILRPIEDMTKEEAIELVRLSSWKQYGPHPLNRNYETYENSFGQIVVSWGGNGDLRTKNVPVEKEVFSADEFLYLIKQRFDLFQLKEKGLAIHEHFKLIPNEKAL